MTLMQQFVVGFMGMPRNGFPPSLPPGLQACLLLSALLFAIGLAGALTRRNAVLVLIGIELMLNAANINFIAFWHYGPATSDITGVMFAIFSIGVAAAEAAVGLAIILAAYRHSRTTDLDKMNSLKG